MPAVSEDEVRDAMMAMRWAATRCGTLPPGVGVDDLESVGGESLARSAADYDPASGVTFATYAVSRAKGEMKDFVRAAWGRHKREKQYPADRITGEQTEPSSEALTPVRMRETVRPRHRCVTVTRVEAESPTAGEVARRVADQQLALFSAFTPEDAGAVMAMVVAKAKAGDLRAARLFLDMVRPRAGSAVQVAVLNGVPDGMIPLGPGEG